MGSSSGVSYQNYVLERVITLSLIGLLAVLVSLVVEVNSFLGWSIFFHIIVGIGMIHYVISFIYQSKAVKKRANKKEIICFLLLGTISASISYFLVEMSATLFAIFGISYFILHGALNEQSLHDRVTNSRMPSWFMWAYLFSTCVAFYWSLPHLSFFISSDLVYRVSENIDVWSVFGTVVSHSAYQITLYIFFLLSIITGIIGYFSSKSGWKYVGLIVLLSHLFFFFLEYRHQLSPIVPYMYALFVLVNFHNVIYSVYFFRIFYNNPAQFNKLLYYHLAILVFLIAIVVLRDFAWLDYIYEYVFNIKTLLLLASVHISLSFLNDSWFRRLVQLPSL